MKHPVLFLFVFLGLLVLSFSGPVAGRALASAPTSAWQIQTIDGGGTVGDTLSLTIDPVSQLPYISYYDSTAKDLKLAYPAHQPGDAHDCGPSNAWSCNSLNFINTLDYGAYSSVAFNRYGDRGIAYASITVASNYFTGSPSHTATQAFYVPIDQAASYHTSTALRYNHDGLAVYAYSAGSDVAPYAGLPYLNVATYVGSGGNCGSGTAVGYKDWQCDQIAREGNLIGDVDLKMIYNTPYVAYDDVNKHLAIAHKLGGGGNCGPYPGPFPGYTWQCDTIDTTDVIKGPISLNLDLAKVGVAYIDTTHQMLKFASGDVVPNGTCASGAWTCAAIDSTGAYRADIYQGASLAAWHGQPLIAYIDSNDQSNSVLKVAYPQAGSTCGALGWGWHCEVVDAGPYDISSPSLQVTSGGAVYLAYFDVTEKKLKMAYHPISVYLPAIIK